jgi:sugar-specific transcriptional regulator TrmB
MSEINNNINEAINEVADNITTTVNSGFRRLGDLIQEALESSGTQQASAFSVENNGVTNIFVSPNDPKLDELVNPAEVKISKVNSATAGM